MTSKPDTLTQAREINAAFDALRQTIEGSRSSAPFRPDLSGNALDRAPDLQRAIFISSDFENTDRFNRLDKVMAEFAKAKADRPVTMGEIAALVAQSVTDALNARQGLDTTHAPRAWTDREVR